MEHWMFTKREQQRRDDEARERGELDESFVAVAPPAFRNQLMYALGDLASYAHPRYGAYVEPAPFWVALRRCLAEEYGRRDLAGLDNAMADVTGHVAHADTPELADLIDAVPIALERVFGRSPAWTQAAMAFFKTVSARFAEHRLPYDIVNGKVVAKDSQELFVAVVRPAITLLQGRQRFERAEEQYQAALHELAMQNWADAITDANAAVEIILRVILGNREQGQLPDLLREASRRNLFGDAQASRIRRVLVAFNVLAEIRNEEGDAHGGVSDRQTAWLAVHWAGALIVFIVEQAETLGL